MIKSSVLSAKQKNVKRPRDLAHDVKFETCLMIGEAKLSKTKSAFPCIGFA